MRSDDLLQGFKHFIILHGKISRSPVRLIIKLADGIHADGLFIFKVFQILHRKRRAGCNDKTPFTVMNVFIRQKFFVFFTADAVLSEKSFGIYNRPLKGKLNIPVKKIDSVKSRIIIRKITQSIMEFLFEWDHRQHYRIFLFFNCFKLSFPNFKKELRRHGTKQGKFFVLCGFKKICL